MKKLPVRTEDIIESTSQELDALMIEIEDDTETLTLDATPQKEGLQGNISSSEVSKNEKE